MKKYLISIAVGIAISLSGISLSFAQDGGPPNFVPVEMQVCNYRDGKDRDDLDKSLNEMTKWMADNDSEPYAGWIVEKWITGGTQDFDFLFLNAWPNGSTMGKDITEYGATAGDAMEAFNDVAECPATLLLGSLTVKEPPEGASDADDFVLTITDCNVADGRKVQDAIQYGVCLMDRVRVAAHCKYRREIAPCPEIEWRNFDGAPQGCYRLVVLTGE
jgi:hypothetical protein